jgi:hypothetical protein
MKKALASIVLFVYVVFSCGLIVNLHYCMGTLDSIALFSAQKDECSQCGMPVTDKTECCKDEVFFFKLNDEQKTSSVSFSIPDAKAIADFSFDLIWASIGQQARVKHLNSHSPPLLTEQDTYLHNCVFRI